MTFKMSSEIPDKKCPKYWALVTFANLPLWEKEEGGAGSPSDWYDIDMILDKNLPEQAKDFWKIITLCKEYNHAWKECWF